MKILRTEEEVERYLAENPIKRRDQPPEYGSEEYTRKIHESAVNFSWIAGYIQLAIAVYFILPYFKC